MKNKVQINGGLFLTMVILALIVLSACASSTVPSGSDTAATSGANGATVPGTNTPVIVPGGAKDSSNVNDADTTGTAAISSGAETGTQVVSDEVKSLLENQDKLNLIVTKGDVAGCKELDMPQFQISCETNILANKAASNKDLAVCDSAGTADVKARCREVVSNKVF